MNMFLPKIVVFIAIIGAFVTNIWANIAPINGLNIGEISNTIFPTVLITPANYAFIIWGIIYLGLISFAVYQITLSKVSNLALNKIRYLLISASIFQIVWVLLFLSRLFYFSLVGMVIILVSLIIAYIEIPKRFNSLKQKWLIGIPISLYTAWISVATIVNVASVLEYSNWNGWGISPETWTVLMMLVAGLIGILIIVRKKDLAFTSVFIWALIAIGIKNSGNNIISIASIGIAIVLGLFSIFAQKLKIN